MKYMGSKLRIKKQIVPILQGIIDRNKIDCYIEPFVGGANVIDAIRCEHKFGNDINSPLINLFKKLTCSNNDILPKEVSKELYDDVRKHKSDNKYEEWFKGAIGFLASYNGRYFDGGYAKTTITKNGNTRNYYDESKRNILKQVDKLKDVSFYNMDYYKLFIPSGSLVYCDPPYRDTKQYDTSKNFDYDMFWNWVREKSKDNIVIVSELQAPDDFKCFWEQEVTRTQDNRKREKSIEKLFIYKGSEDI